MCPAETQIILLIRFSFFATQIEPREDFDQTAQVYM